ncbi:MAG: protein kinase domain-containing protein [Bradymonadaceae bacterium]
MSKNWARKELARLVDEHALDPTLVPTLMEILDQAAGQNPHTLLDEQESANTMTFGPTPTGRNAATTFKRIATLASDPNAPSASLFGRYELLKLIGQGGMGEVYRVRDPHLNRKMVMKVIRADRLGDQGALIRFIEEAQITSQLQHPGIVPVHELGTLGDGRIYFTMKEVRGRTLCDVITEEHEHFADLDETARIWETSFRRLIGIFQRVCEPVAYAHSKKIVHRDLKPSNIMVGDFGEVQIIDWGLAKLLGVDSESVGREELTLDARGLGEESSAVSTERSGSQSFDTGAGNIVGTPAFMAPEQAHGSVDLAVSADVYSLGVILFMLLDGAVPYTGNSPGAIIMQVVEGELRTPGQTLGAPEELQNICLKAMAMNPEDRFSTAAELAEAIAAWRDGSHRRDRARELVREATRLIPQVHALKTEALALCHQANELLDALPGSSPVEEKEAAWLIQDEATFLGREAEAKRGRLIQLLDTALTYVPTLAGAHEHLADIYHAEHVEAEERRDHEEATMAEVFLKAHDHGKYSAYLAGKGRLTLITEPDHARVEIFRYAQRSRRLVPTLGRSLGWAPIHHEQLSMGSYLLTLKAPGRATVKYPVFIDRQGHWDGVPPGQTSSLPIRLPLEDELGSDDIYVPAGCCRIGGQHPRKIWVDAFVIKRHPVTNARYLEFLNDLLEREDWSKVRPFLPREVGSTTPSETPIYIRGDDGRLMIPEDHPEYARWPVQFIDWHSAAAYAEWYAEATALPWRLPMEDEWEKAARGVDGRFFPWGDFLDPTWCRMLHSTSAIPKPAPVREYTDDESPYGVLGMAGNVRDWCADIFPVDADTSLRVYRGGCWFSLSDLCRVESRELKPPEARSAGTGFRLARFAFPQESR